VANPPDPNTEKSEMRVMWLGAVAIVLLLLGAMGINMLMTHNTAKGSVEPKSGAVLPSSAYLVADQR
jgi:hypothetical protein